MRIKRSYSNVAQLEGVCCVCHSMSTLKLWQTLVVEFACVRFKAASERAESRRILWLMDRPGIGSEARSDVKVQIPP